MHLVNKVNIFTNLNSTFVPSRCFRNLVKDERVWRGDDDQWQQIDGDDIEEIIGQLMLLCGEEVERHTLLKPRE